MARFLDFSPYVYVEDIERKNTLNVGWIDSTSEFETEDPDENILIALWGFCLVSVAQSRGVYECDLCPDLSRVIEERNGVSLGLGSAEIRVFGNDGTVYAAPNLIFHYVKAHNYKLPEEFVRALLDSPRPPSDDYFLRLKEQGLSWGDTIRKSRNEERYFLF